MATISRAVVRRVLDAKNEEYNTSTIQYMFIPYNQARSQGGGGLKGARPPCDSVVPPWTIGIHIVYFLAFSEFFSETFSIIIYGPSVSLDGPTVAEILAAGLSEHLECS